MYVTLYYAAPDSIENLGTRHRSMSDGKRAADAHFSQHHPGRLQWQDSGYLATAAHLDAFYVVRELEVTER